MYLHVVRVRSPLAPLDPAAQAEQEGGPLGAAVVHELDRVAPAGVGEEDEGLVLLLQRRKVRSVPIHSLGPPTHFHFTTSPGFDSSTFIWKPPPSGLKCSVPPTFGSPVVPTIHQ